MTDSSNSGIASFNAATATGTSAPRTDRLSTRANLEKAGQQFEAVFTQMMMKSMRAPHLAEDLFGSKAQDTFTEMQDAQYAQAMAQHAPLGIGKAMVDFLSKAQAASAQADPTQAGPTEGAAAATDGSATP